MTLIELLIVIIIMVMVVSVAIPLLKFNFGDKKIRETARQLNAYFALAKSLAAERNRQVGVMFERTPGNLNQCISIYLVEVPPPYSGDVLDARAYVAGIPTSIWPPTERNGRSCSTRWMCSPDRRHKNAPCSRYSRSLVNADDTFLIRFNYRGTVYHVKRFQVNAAQNDLFVMQGNPSPVPDRRLLDAL